MGISGKNLARFLSASLMVAILVAVLNFVVDPLQLFRPANLTKAFYTSNHRMQAAGLIRSQSFNTVYIGTSLAVHFRPSDIDRMLGVKSVKLAMSGGLSPEQSFTIRTAIAVKHPKEVIWEMDDWIFVDAPDVDSKTDFPADLFRRNSKGIASYLLSLDTTRESMWLILRHIKLLDNLAVRLTWAGYLKYHNDNVDEIDTVPRYVDLRTVYGGGKALAAYQGLPDPYLASYSYEVMVRNFDRDALDIIRSNPNVRFVIYFPPYSILRFVAMRDFSPAALKIIYDFSAFASQMLAALPNVSLYDFREVKEVTHDHSNYADLRHHSPDVDLKVLSWLAAGDYVVDRAAPTASLDRLKRQVEAYKIDDLEH